MRRSLPILMASVLLVLACGDASRVSEASSELLAASDAPLPPGAAQSGHGSESAGDAAAAAAGESEPAAAEPDKRVYYQFIDESGAVQFVDSLERVPPQWRDRAGVVELGGAAPPSSPRDAAQARSERLARLREASKRTAATARRTPDVILYYADWCPYCRKARAYLDDRGVPYDLRDIDIPSYKEELVRKTGRASIPVIDVGGQIISGFNEKKLARLLGEAY